MGLDAHFLFFPDKNKFDWKTVRNADRYKDGKNGIKRIAGNESDDIHVYKKTIVKQESKEEEVLIKLEIVKLAEDQLTGEGIENPIVVEDFD